jgi:hypothetical protein
VPRDQRPFAWFARFLDDAGCVVLDNRECSGLWPVGVRHDVAFFAETGLGGVDDLTDREDEDGSDSSSDAAETGPDLESLVGGSACATDRRPDTVIAGGNTGGRQEQEVGRR